MVVKVHNIVICQDACVHVQGLGAQYSYLSQIRMGLCVYVFRLWVYHKQIYIYIYIYTYMYRYLFYIYIHIYIYIYIYPNICKAFPVCFPT